MCWCTCDDIIITGSLSKFIFDLKYMLNREFTLKDLGPPKISKGGSSPSHYPQLYISIIGSLHYAINTHPEVTFVVNKVSQYMGSPTEDHWKANQKDIEISKRCCLPWYCVHESF